MSNCCIESVRRLGRNRGEGLIWVKFASCTKKLLVLHAKRYLAGMSIRIDENFSIKIQEKLRQLIPYLKDAKTQGNMVFSKRQIDN